MHYMCRSLTRVGLFIGTIQLKPTIGFSSMIRQWDLFPFIRADEGFRSGATPHGAKQNLRHHRRRVPQGLNSIEELNWNTPKTTKYTKNTNLLCKIHQKHQNTFQKSSFFKNIKKTQVSKHFKSVKLLFCILYNYHNSYFVIFVVFVILVFL